MKWLKIELKKRAPSSKLNYIGGHFSFDKFKDQSFEKDILKYYTEAKLRFANTNENTKEQLWKVLRKK